MDAATIEIEDSIRAEEDKDVGSETLKKILAKKRLRRETWIEENETALAVHCEDTILKLMAKF